MSTVADPPAPLTYSVAEAAALLGVSVDAVYDAVARGQLPGRKVGRRWIIPRIKLEAFINGDEP